MPWNTCGSLLVRQLAETFPPVIARTTAERRELDDREPGEVEDLLGERAVGQADRVAAGHGVAPATGVARRAARWPANEARDARRGRVLIGTMVVALATAIIPGLHQQGSHGFDVVIGALGSLELTYVVIFGWLVFAGAGRASLDHLLATRVRAGNATAAV